MLWALVRAAQATHPTVMSRVSLKASAAADTDGAKWGRYPTPTVEAQRDRDTQTSTGLFRLQQPLWAGGRITGTIAAAEQREAAADAAVDEVKDEIARRVFAAYAEALRQQSRKLAAQASVTGHGDLLGMITRRVEAEVSPPIDRELAQSRYFQAVNELTLAEQGLSAALTQLSQLTGTIVTEVVLEDPESLPRPPATMADALSMAKENSATLVRLQKELEAANAEIDIKRSSYSPQLSLRYEREAGGDLPPDSRVLLVLEAQPGAGFSAVSGVNGAIGRREAARQAKEGAIRDLEERVYYDWNDVLAGRSRVSSSASAKGISTQVAESYSRQYMAGRKSWLDVLNAMREAATAEFTLADSQAQYLGARLRLALVTGSLGAWTRWWRAGFRLSLRERPPRAVDEGRVRGHKLQRHIPTPALPTSGEGENRETPPPRVGEVGRGMDCGPRIHWIPACAGMTALYLTVTAL